MVQMVASFSVRSIIVSGLAQTASPIMTGKIKKVLVTIDLRVKFF